MLDLDAFATDGFAKIEKAAPRPAADEARGILWRQLGLSPDDRDQWIEAVRWASDLMGHGPFGELVRSRPLAAALDAVCGSGDWVPRRSLGNVPVRFPVSPPNDDRGWHIDANTPLSDGSWAVTGRPHTVLLLTLLSDVGPDDAPTRIRAGSHHDVARVLGWALTRWSRSRWAVWSTTQVHTGRSCTPPVSPATCTSFTRSRCTPPTSIAALPRASWRRRRSC
jgi:hypothetical protein